jgi:hypothetical protein
MACGTVVASPGDVGGARPVDGSFGQSRVLTGAFVRDLVVDTEQGHRTVTESRNPGSVTP